MSKAGVDSLNRHGNNNDLSMIEEITINILDLTKPVIIQDAVIKTVDLRFTTFHHEVCVRNSIIETLLLHSAFFEGGFTIENCIVKNHIQYEMGGHNKKPVRIINSIFESLFVFFDCVFVSDIVIKNNIFLEGSTLFNGTNSFEISPNTENNVGALNIMQCE